MWGYLIGLWKVPESRIWWRRACILRHILNQQKCLKQRHCKEFKWKLHQFLNVSDTRRFSILTMVQTCDWGIFMWTANPLYSEPTTSNALFVLLTARNNTRCRTMSCFQQADSLVMIKGWITPVTAVCEGFPTLPHKGGLAKRQHVLRHCLWAETTRSPSLSHCQSNNTMLRLLRCRQPPPYLLSQLLPAPATHTLDNKEWWHGVFFSSECGLLVNSWASIHSAGMSSQVKTRWLCITRLQKEDMNIDDAHTSTHAVKRTSTTTVHSVPLQDPPRLLFLLCSTGFQIKQSLIHGFVDYLWWWIDVFCRVLLLPSRKPHCLGWNWSIIWTEVGDAICPGKAGNNTKQMDFLRPESSTTEDHAGPEPYQDEPLA